MCTVSRQADNDATIIFHVQRGLIESSTHGPLYRARSIAKGSAPGGTRYYKFSMTSRSNLQLSACMVKPESGRATKFSVYVHSCIISDTLHLLFDF
jgi:hypothetical protein